MMPEDIDEVEHGLDRICATVPAEDRVLVQSAIDWARDVHRGQIRKDGASLFTHVVAVAINLLDQGVDGTGLIVAGLLHDVVERR